MTQEDKDLLLKDLCARLPYGVFCEGITMDIDIDTDRYYNHKVKGVLSEIHHYKSDYAIIGLMSECKLETIKPYLYPLSSMTEEQKEEIEDKLIFPSNSNGGWIEILYNDIYNIPFWFVDFCNKNHFDYRGLIEKSLAIDATNLGIYK